MRFCIQIIQVMLKCRFISLYYLGGDRFSVSGYVFLFRLCDQKCMHTKKILHIFTQAQFLRLVLQINSSEWYPLSSVWLMLTREYVQLGTTMVHPTLKHNFRPLYMIWSSVTEWTTKFFAKMCFLRFFLGITVLNYSAYFRKKNSNPFKTHLSLIYRQK